MRKADGGTRKSKEARAPKAKRNSEQLAAEQGETKTNIHTGAGTAQSGTFALTAQSMPLAIAAGPPGGRGTGAQVVEEEKGSLGGGGGRGADRLLSKPQRPPSAPRGQEEAPERSRKRGKKGRWGRGLSYFV